MVKNLILANNWKAGCRETCMPGLGRGDWKPAFARRWFPTSPTLMLENGADLLHLQQILGHQQINTTSIYTKVEISKLKNIHEKTHPSNKVKEPLAQEQNMLKAPKNRDKPCNKFKANSFWQQQSQDPCDFIALGARYINWLELNDYALGSIKNHSHYLRYFVEWCQKNAIHSPALVTRSVIEDYQSYLTTIKSSKTGQPVSNYNIFQRLNTLKSFFNWLANNNCIANNPTSAIENPKLANRLPKTAVLSVEEVKAILQVPDISTALGIRDRAILETFYATGIRRNELRQLKIEDINFDNGTLFVFQGKGKKDRFVPISQNALNWIAKYLEEVRSFLIPEKDEGYLFLTQNKGPFAARPLSEHIGNIVKKANIGKTGSCHLFRSACATHMLEQGASVRYIQEVLGHSDITSTQCYAKVTISELKKVHKRTHPARMHSVQTKEILSQLEQVKENN